MTSSVVYSDHYVIECMILTNKCLYNKLVNYIKEDLPHRTITLPRSLSMGDETAEQRSLRQGLIREWLEDLPFSLEEYYGPLVLTMLLYGIYDAEFRDSVRVEQREDQDLRA